MTPPERKTVRPALRESYEGLFHEMEANDFFLKLGDAAPDVLRPPRLERAIGVLYLPRTERQSHYFRCRLPEQFDAVFHFDRTHALQPIDNVSEWRDGSPVSSPSFGIQEPTTENYNRLLIPCSFPSPCRLMLYLQVVGSSKRIS